MITPEPQAGNRWEHHFLHLALVHSNQSKDPRTRVGAVIMTADRTPVSSGFNGFPRGIADTPERLADRTTKNSIMTHAEQNCLMNALRQGVSTMGCHLYIACTDDTGEVWGGAPCAERCIGLIIQAGIKRVIAYPMKAESSWNAQIATSTALMAEAGIEHRVILKPPGLVHAKPRWYDR